MSTREYTNSPKPVGEDEIIAFTIDTSTWPGTGDPTSIVTTLTAEDGSSTSGKLTGSDSTSGDTITTKGVTGLTAGVRYRMETKWVKSGNTMESFGFVEAET